jgi:N-methylhydantoinase A/oxoprolinase/acetone carboxylase beta subunit
VARYGHGSSGEEAELVTLRLRAQGPPLLQAGGLCVVSGETKGAAIHPLDIWFDAAGPVKGNWRLRETLAEGEVVLGPAVIAGEDSTILVPPDARGICSAGGHMALEVG